MKKRELEREVQTLLTFSTLHSRPIVTVSEHYYQIFVREVCREGFSDAVQSSHKHSDFSQDAFEFD